MCLVRNLLLALPLLLAGASLHANNIQITNPTLTGNNSGSGFVLVQFDISWANNWRTSSAPNNWDAGWVFVKYRTSSGVWEHARLNDAGHTAPAGSTISTGLLDPGSAFDASTNPGIGDFVYRYADGTGTFTANGTQLHWNYGANGITYADIVEVKVFAVQMVWVPQGSFPVGSGGTENYAFKNGTTTTPFSITTEAALTMGNVNGQLWATGAIGAATLPAGFPKGFAGFYCMKHEISQQGYVDMLNTLTRTQQSTRVATGITGTSVTNRYVMANTSSVGYRNGIRCNATIPAAPTPVSFYCDLNANGTGGEAADGQWIACNWLGWADVAAYLDWSGLRPMTELEYEKACRGPVAPVANEYAWGNTSITGAANITNGGATNESSNTAGANAVNNSNANVQGPMRVGVFAGGATTRVQSGASYYGILELSGNLWERPVTVGNATGRAFTGVLGNGALDATGNADAANWPGTSAQGAGFRGGGWSDAPARFRPLQRRHHLRRSQLLLRRSWCARVSLGRGYVHPR